MSGKFRDGLENFRLSGKYLDDLESFRMVLKVSGWSGKCLDVQVINFEKCALE